jgi:hypothetical protein
MGQKRKLLSYSKDGISSQKATISMFLFAVADMYRQQTSIRADAHTSNSQERMSTNWGDTWISKQKDPVRSGFE